MDINSNDLDLSTLFSRLRGKLERRRVEGSYRSLIPIPSHETSVHQTEPSVLEKSIMVDFASNDYLGLAHCPRQMSLVQQSFDAYTRSCISEANHHQTQCSNRGILGATGSRLLSGDSVQIRNLEHYIANVHKRPAALLCNSGYDANLSVISSLPVEGDFIVADSLIHNSLIMGIRMGRVKKSDCFTFSHNDVVDLRRILTCIQNKKWNKMAYPEIFILIESVYSMDGDIAPVQDILDLALEYGAHVIVDEAHGFGIFGPQNAQDLILPEDRPIALSPESKNETIKGRSGLGVLAALGLENHKALLASIYTFGKAAGCHGAVVVSCALVIEYLVNYARPFIYSTGLPPHSVITISCSYRTIMGHEGDSRRRILFQLVRFFRSSLRSALRHQLHLPTEDINSLVIPSPTPIQAILCKGNETCILWARALQCKGIKVFPIRFPTVAKGSERIRIILHYHNTEDQISKLVDHLIYLISLRTNDPMRSRL